MNKHRALCGVIVCLASAPVWAIEPVRDHQVTIDDYFTIAVVGQAVVSPKGTYVAYTETRWEPPEESRNTDIWVVSTTTREPTRLTFEPGDDGSPQWSPDEQWVYFSAKRKRSGEEKAPYNDKLQVWRVPVTGGDAQPVTRVTEGLDAYQLAEDGKALYYTVGQEQHDDDPWKELRKQFGKLTYGHGVVKASQVWKLDLPSWRAEKLVDEKRVIREFAVSPDQKLVAMLTTPTEELLSNEGWSRVDIFDVETKKTVSPPDKLWRQEAPSPYGWLLGLAWSSDSQALAFRVDFDGYPGEAFVTRLPPGAEPTVQKIQRVGEVTLIGAVRWRPGSNDLCFVGEDRARARVYLLRDVRPGTQGETVAVTGGDVCVDHFSVSRSGDRAAVVMGSLTHPPDVFVLAVTKEAKGERLTTVNPQVDRWRLPKIELVSWKAPDGTNVEGILELPPDHAAGTKLPMVVELHGGPTGATRFQMRYWIYGRTLFASRGWALLSPNYRGSTGFGDKFMTDLIGRENDVEVKDILAGVDAMVERGLADPDKLAVMGWSNGGYLTNCLITQTTRFKAASSGAGVFDAATQWLAEDTPGHVINFMKGFPWNQSDEFRESSALYRVDKVTTPTLIHVGENDPRCPPAHSQGLYRALHHYLKVPSELIVYPGEGHSLTKYTHRKAKLEWDVKWFDHWVLNKPTEDKPVEKPATVD